jgi:hypothetical protein
VAVLNKTHSAAELVANLCVSMRWRHLRRVQLRPCYIQRAPAALEPPARDGVGPATSVKRILGFVTWLPDLRVHIRHRASASFASQLGSCANALHPWRNSNICNCCSLGRCNDRLKPLKAAGHRRGGSAPREVAALAETTIGWQSLESRLPLEKFCDG